MGILQAETNASCTVLNIEHHNSPHGVKKRCEGFSLYPNIKKDVIYVQLNIYTITESSSVIGVLA